MHSSINSLNEIITKRIITLRYFIDELQLLSDLYKLYEDDSSKHLIEAEMRDGLDFIHTIIDQIKKDINALTEEETRLNLPINLNYRVIIREIDNYYKQLKSF